MTYDNIHTTSNSLIWEKYYIEYIDNTTSEIIANTQSMDTIDFDTFKVHEIVSLPVVPPDVNSIKRTLISISIPYSIIRYIRPKQVLPTEIIAIETYIE